MKSTLVSVCLAFFSATFCFFVEGLAQERQMGGSAGITVFADSNYHGKSATYTTDIPNLATVGFNDEISSLKVAAGEEWEVCEDINYGGRCVVVTGEEFDLRRNSWGKVISSIRRVVRPGNRDYVVLFTQSTFRGTATNFDRSTPNLFTLNARTRSITIGSGTWEFCQRVNFGGRCIRLSQSVANVPGAMSISSLRPIGGGSTSGPNLIVIFDQTNFRGTRTNFNVQQTNINRRVRSATIGGGVWEICDGRNFTGRCITLNQSTSNLAGFNISATIRSLRPLTRMPR